MWLVLLPRNKRAMGQSDLRKQIVYESGRHTCSHQGRQVPVGVYFFVKKKLGSLVLRKLRTNVHNLYHRNDKIAWVIPSILLKHFDVSHCFICCY